MANRYDLRYPLINGHRFSFASVEIQANGIPFGGFKSINYSAALEPGDLYSTSPDKIGRTRGKATYTCDAEMYRLEWENFKFGLGREGVGYGEVPMLITVCHSENQLLGLPQPVITDLIEGARITKTEFSHAEGTDGLTVKLTFNVMRIKENGVQTISLPAFR